MSRLFLFVPLPLLLLSSCLADYPVTVEVSLAEIHPFEEVSGAFFWHELTYFDGEEIKTVHVPTGERSVEVDVRSGSLAVFVFTPLGSLGPIGAFYEPGDDKTVRAIGDEGSFASMLLYVAGYRPDAVSRLSVRNLREYNTDLSALDEVEFMTDLVNGTVYKGQLALASKDTVEIDTVPSGEWVSERYDVESFSLSISGRTVYLELYPGDYHYACFERSMLLEVIYDEDGDVTSSVTALSTWW